MIAGPGRRKKTVGHLFVPDAWRVETERIMRRFDPFLLEVLCQAKRERGVCGGRYGVFSGDGSTHCQRCGAPVPAPRRTSYQVGDL